MSLDNPTQREGDSGFIGMASRINPLQLKEGMVQLSENMRLDRGVAQTRKGAKRLADAISAGETELVLDFTLGSDVAVSSITRAGSTATVTTAAPHGEVVGQIINLRGATQTEYNGDFAVGTVPTSTTFTITVSGTPATPATGTITLNGGPVVRSNYSGGVFAAGIYSSPRLDDSNEYIVLAGPDAAYLWRDGASLVTKSYPTSPVTEQVLPTDDVSIIQAFDKLYLLRFRDETEYRLSSLTQTTGTATATTPTPHGYTVGEVVRILGSDQAGYNADFLVSSAPTSTTFTFAVPTGPVTPSTGVAFARRVCAPLVWDGGTGNFVRVGLGSHAAGATFSKMPSASIATYTNNQLLIARNRDEVLISDVLDAETYDPLLKSFRANAGSNDQIVALHPYAEGQVLVFCRKSIYLATVVMASDGISIDPANSSLQLLTNEVGCCARRSIATAGIYVYFLSDSGVYRLDNQFDLKLRGNTKPLSDPIANLLNDINIPVVGLSNGIFFNNRYYLAVPTKLANGDLSSRPNTLFIYNMLNEAWESRDYYAFNLDNLLVTDYGTERRLYSASRNGKLYLLDQYDSGLDDQPTGAGTYVVEGELLTRRYGFGTLTRKRLTRTVASVVLPAGASAAADAITTDADADFEILSLTNNGISLEDYTVKGPIRRNANMLDLRWRTTGGRPILRAITAEATVDSLPKTGTRTEE
jgi:hypothetical protein